MPKRPSPERATAAAAGEGGDPMGEVVARVRQITRENERLFSELIAGERRFRALARSVWAVQEEERRRLARELHDGIGQTLTALKGHLEVLRRERREGDPALAAGIALAGQALQETRELSRLLRPQILDDLGLEPALRWLTRTVEESSGMAVALATRGLGERLPRELETLAFRVVQEALNNAVKHAHATRVEVAAAADGGWLSLRVADDGVGFDSAAAAEPPAAAGGSGLRGMRDRVELFSGRLRITAAPGAGTRIEAQVPLAEREEG
ncbi:MAG TPA: sensor histidine kinase [Thermoanaerobaculia bacterium]|nr:sensor histidine kinase [Thermoanaerobaculia bacterium]